MSLPKTGILRGEKRVAALFAGGAAGFCYPFRYVWRTSEGEGAGVLFSVPKKNFKRAVKRNLIRRRMKEAYRLNKSGILETAAGKGRHIELALIYSAKEIHDFKTVSNGVKRVLAEIRERL